MFVGDMFSKDSFVAKRCLLNLMRTSISCVGAFQIGSIKNIAIFCILEKFDV